MLNAVSLSSRVVLSNAACAGTDNDCATVATCNNAAGYYGDAQVLCPGEGGLFRAYNCFRQRYASDDTNVSTVYYPVSSMVRVWLYDRRQYPKLAF